LTTILAAPPSLNRDDQGFDFFCVQVVVVAG
jgi:hypothetical protein